MKLNQWWNVKKGLDGLDALMLLQVSIELK